MKKEVRLKIRSTRYEVEASLFTDDMEYSTENIVELKDAEPETVEINTVGHLTDREGRISVSYEETEVTGMDGSSTEVTFMREDGGIVSMIREGAVSTALVFEEGKRHHCVYNTPFMPFQVCIHTVKVENRIIEEGYIDLDYIVEIRGAQAERTKFRMELL